MYRPRRIPDRDTSGASFTNMGLLTLVIVAVFLALTFGEAEGMIHLF